MKKITSLGLIALLLLTLITSVVSAEEVYISENIYKSYTYNGRDLHEEKITYFKWYWNLLKDYAKVIKENRELRSELNYLKENPIIEVKHHTSTRTVTNTEYVICEECNPSPYCPPPRHLVWSGLNQCGCKENVRCVLEASIKPIAREI